MDPTGEAETVLEAKRNVERTRKFNRENQQELTAVVEQHERCAKKHEDARKKEEEVKVNQELKKKKEQEEAAKAEKEKSKLTEVAETVAEVVDKVVTSIPKSGYDLLQVAVHDRTGFKTAVKGVEMLTGAVKEKSKLTEVAETVAEVVEKVVTSIPKSGYDLLQVAVHDRTGFKTAVKGVEMLTGAVKEKFAGKHEEEEGSKEDDE